MSERSRKQLLLSKKEVFSLIIVVVIVLMCVEGLQLFQLDTVHSKSSTASEKTLLTSTIESAHAESLVKEVANAEHLKDANSEERNSILHLKAECDLLSAVWDVNNIDNIDSHACERLQIACGVKSCYKAVLDVVILYVNGTDPIWRAKYDDSIALMRELEAPTVPDDIGDSRFRDFGQMRYALRSLEVNAEWVRRIYLISDNQWPDYLRPADETLRFRHVTHDDLFAYYLSAKNKTSDRVLPWYNDNILDMLTPFIPSLGNVYVHMNDDFSFIKPTPLDFMYNTVTHKAVLRLWKNMSFRYKAGRVVVAQDIAEQTLKRRIQCPRQKKNKDCPIPFHGPNVVVKQLLLDAWESTAQEKLDRMLLRPFRTERDVHPWVMMMLLGWESDFEIRDEPYDILFRQLETKNYKSTLGEVRADTKTKILCLNDDMGDNLPERFIHELNAVYADLFPHKTRDEH